MDFWIGCAFKLRYVRLIWPKMGKITWSSGALWLVSANWEHWCIKVFNYINKNFTDSYFRYNLFKFWLYFLFCFLIAFMKHFIMFFISISTYIYRWRKKLYRFIHQCDHLAKSSHNSLLDILIHVSIELLVFTGLAPRPIKFISQIRLCVFPLCVTF